MDGKAEAVLRFALSTLFMKQGRSPAGRGEVSVCGVEAGGSGLAAGADDVSDYGFEPDQVDVDACSEQPEEGDAGQQLLDFVHDCMGRLRDVCEDSCQDDDREGEVERGFRDVARELREYSTLHGIFDDLLRLLVNLLRAADAEGETMDVASISHVLTHLCFEDINTPSSRFNEVVEFLLAVLNDAQSTSLSEWVLQSLDAIEATVHGSS